MLLASPPRVPPDHQSGTRAEFWAAKFERNTERDARKERELKALSWQVLIVWECETFDPAALVHRHSQKIQPVASMRGASGGIARDPRRALCTI